MKRIRRVRYTQDRPYQTFNQNSIDFADWNSGNPQSPQMVRRPVVQSIKLVQKPKIISKFRHTSFNLSQNQRQYNTIQPIEKQTQSKPIPSPIYINLDKFEDYFIEMKNQQRTNMLFDFKVQNKKLTNKKAIITFQRYPDTFKNAVNDQSQQLTNNFIVQKLKGPQKSQKPYSFNKFVQSLHMGHNFEGRKVQRSSSNTQKCQKIVKSHNKLQRIIMLKPSRNSLNKTIEKKMTYQAFLDLVLNSNNFNFKQISFPHFYNVYIEQGNNHQILKTLARRKNGWRVVESPEVANLIWTQRYKKNLGVRPKRAGNMQMYAQLRQKINQTNLREKQSKSQTKNALISTSSKIKIKVDASKCNKGQTMTFFNRNPNSKTLSPDKKNNQATIQVMSKEQQDYDTLLGRITKKNILAKKFYQDFTPSLNITILNHMPGNRCICDKKNLLSNMFDYYTSKKKDPFDYIPYSATISTYEKFQAKKNQLRMISIAWIVKPGQDTNRGKGISVCSNWDEVEIQIKQRFGINQDNSKSQKKLCSQAPFDKYLVSSVPIKPTNESKDTPLPALKGSKSLILQRYISPLLYQKRKFDIRAYLLVTCSNAKIKAYFYQEGYIRTCAMPFSMKSNNKYIHLTNDAVQAYATDYGRYQQGNKLSYRQFQKWFSEQVQSNIGQKAETVLGQTQKNDCKINEEASSQLKIKDSSQQFSCSLDIQQTNQEEQKQASKSRWKQIQGQMVKISKDIIKSVKNKIILPSQRIRNIQEGSLHFQLYGLDFMIDDNLKLWLIEVNNNPALTTDCSRLLARLIPAMLDNMLMIAVEPYMRPHKIRQGKYQNRFQVIYEEK